VEQHSRLDTWRLHLHAGARDPCTFCGSLSPTQFGDHHQTIRLAEFGTGCHQHSSEAVRPQLCLPPPVDCHGWDASPNTAVPLVAALVAAHYSQVHFHNQAGARTDRRHFEGNMQQILNNHPLQCCDGVLYDNSPLCETVAGLAGGFFPRPAPRPPPRPPPLLPAPLPRDAEFSPLPHTVCAKSELLGDIFKLKLVCPVIFSTRLCTRDWVPTSLELARPRLDCTQPSLLLTSGCSGQAMSRTVLAKSDQIERPGVWVPLWVQLIVISTWVRPASQCSSSSSPPGCSSVGRANVRPV
jgi:hypothetical protein